jgi:hypothetical protein
MPDRRWHLFASAFFFAHRARWLVLAVKLVWSCAFRAGVNNAGDL